MFGKIFEFIVLAVMVVAELFGMAASGNDMSSKPCYERAQYVIDNIDAFEGIKDAAYDEPYAGPIQTIFPKRIAAKDFKVMEHVVRQDRMKLYNNDDMTRDYLMMDLYGRVDGFSDTAYMYFYGDPASSINKLSFGKASYDSSRQCYVIYNAVNYREISQITGNWYISTTAYSRDSEFKVKPANS